VKPFATLCVAGVCCAVHFRVELGLPVPSLSDVCTSPMAMITTPSLERFGRLLASAFYHSSDWHLYYNMASLVWKGVNLENAMGAEPFLTMFVTLLVASKVLFVAVSYLAMEVGISDELFSCSVGISGVLFALKVIMTHNDAGDSTLFFFPIPTRYLAWGELLLYQMLYPHLSFTGHLAGIFAGYLYLKGKGVAHAAMAHQPRGASRTANAATYGAGRSGTAADSRDESSQRPAGSRSDFQPSVTAVPPQAATGSNTQHHEYTRMSHDDSTRRRHESSFDAPAASQIPRVIEDTTAPTQASQTENPSPMTTSVYSTQSMSDNDWELVGGGGGGTGMSAVDSASDSAVDIAEVRRRRVERLGKKS